jgi:ATP-dependent DNA helicase MPH1
VIATTTAIMDSSGEDYDEFGDEDLIEEHSQPSQTLPTHTNYSRPSKRRKISTSEYDSIDDFIDDKGSKSATRSRKGGQVYVEDNSLDEFEDTEVRKRKPKYKIHIPRANALPATTVQYGTQQQDDLNSSPYRIRGAKWKLPKAAATKSPPSRTQKLRQARTEPVLEKNSILKRPSPSNPSASNSTKSKRATASLSPLGNNAVNILVPPAGPSAADIARELDDLPSDAFLSSPDVSPSIHPTNLPSQPQQRLVGPQTGLRQTTLFGGRAPEDVPPSSQINKVHNYRVDTVPEAPTHHKLDREALKTWVYPTNLGPTRDYQFNIVRQGLFNNMLVALPTGLGKTFIAATIMLNYFRWTKDSQIVFMAPTKPLVSQQVDACFNITGIPRSATTMLTGEIPPAVRKEEWQDKRVFFMTPQTLDNDLRSGIADPKKIVLLVVDEAHRATGNYSYVKVVSFMRRFSKSFRILALTATPGASVEAVQEVIDGLEISKVEIRTEESMDIQQFTHRRKIEQILLDPSDEIIMVKDLFSKAFKPLLDQLCSQNAYWNKDPMSLTTYGLMQAQKSWLMSDAGRRANFGLKGMMRSLFSILTSVAHGIKLLNFHGIGPFYGTMRDFRAGVEERGDKAGKYRKQINDNSHFKTLMNRLETWVNKDDFVGHPKLTYLCDTILNHFLDAGEGKLPDGAPHSGTRVIVFAEYRDSAEGICRVLNRHKPMIRASVFVGQADSKRSEGMNQAKQIDTISKFKTGTFNVLVATSIGEEGLDIGQVDLIVCYDASGSPIRMLQRMGRTGRKRAGNIVLLLMRGKEEEAFAKSKDNYEQMQKMIASGTRFNFRHDLATRIVPKDISPTVDKRHVEIPLENTQDHSLPEPKRRPSKAKKKSAKKFHMPDSVETGFRKASMFAKHDEGSEDSE